VRRVKFKQDRKPIPQKVILLFGISFYVLALFLFFNWSFIKEKTVSWVFINPIKIFDQPQAPYSDALERAIKASKNIKVVNK
jgi:hypothetical protein